jgi:hypothetical protein
VAVGQLLSASVGGHALLWRHCSATSCSPLVCESACTALRPPLHARTQIQDPVTLTVNRLCHAGAAVAKAHALTMHSKMALLSVVLALGLLAPVRCAATPPRQATELLGYLEDCEWRRPKRLPCACSTVTRFSKANRKHSLHSHHTPTSRAFQCIQHTTTSALSPTRAPTGAHALLLSLAHPS